MQQCVLGSEALKTRDWPPSDAYLGYRTASATSTLRATAVATSRRRSGGCSAT